MSNIIVTKALIRQATPVDKENPGNDARLTFFSEDENAPCFQMKAVLRNCCTWTKNDDGKWSIQFNEDLPPLLSYNKDGTWILHPFTIEFAKNTECWEIVDIRFANGNSALNRYDEINAMFEALKGGVR